MKTYQEHPDHPGEQVVVCFGCHDEITRNTDPPTDPEHPDGPCLVCYCDQYAGAASRMKRGGDRLVPRSWLRPSGVLDDTLVADVEHWRATGEKRRTPGKRIPIPELLPTVDELLKAMKEYRRLSNELSHLGGQIIGDAKKMYEGGIPEAAIRRVLSATPAFAFGQYLKEPRPRGRGSKAVRS